MSGIPPYPQGQYPPQYNFQPPPYQPPPLPPPPQAYGNPYQTPPPPPPQPYQSRPVRTKPMYLEPPKPSNAIFIKSLPYDLSLDEFNNIFGQFGEIASTSTNHIRGRGIAFVTYYNILSAMEAVEKMKNIKVHDRYPVTTFSFKPPNYSHVDAKTTSTVVLVQPIHNSSHSHNNNNSSNNQSSQQTLTTDMVSQVLSKFGQIHVAREISPNQITVQFCDLRYARQAAESCSKIDIGGISCKVDLFVEPDGECIYQPVPTPPNYQNRNGPPPPPPPPPPPQYPPQRPPPQYQPPPMPPQYQPPPQMPPPQYPPPPMPQQQMPPPQMPPQQMSPQMPPQMQSQMQPQMPPQMQNQMQPQMPLQMQNQMLQQMQPQMPPPLPPYQQMAQYQQQQQPPTQHYPTYNTGQGASQHEVNALLGRIKNGNL